MNALLFASERFRSRRMTVVAGLASADRVDGAARVARVARVAREVLGPRTRQTQGLPLRGSVVCFL